MVQMALKFLFSFGLILALWVPPLLYPLPGEESAEEVKRGSLSLGETGGKPSVSSVYQYPNRMHGYLRNSFETYGGQSSGSGILRQVAGILGHLFGNGDNSDQSQTSTVQPTQTSTIILSPLPLSPLETVQSSTSTETETVSDESQTTISSSVQPTQASEVMPTPFSDVSSPLEAIDPVQNTTAVSGIQADVEDADEADGDSMELVRRYR
ncbi:hypothetical protein M422DRAFT_275576 [Sphaerobolus stellatus SS14]|uniref:Uncharacterized protein n=1 Tax=Sphaerobolus stellatus (strain SS14) TaxID=990650 RepID=A0A0C9UE77_SPHS4|nr:hypothetical protein M422DRAFT_275576 [Sphaerobolus stellatus SS14]